MMNRRTLLRGAGVSLALPLLDSLLPLTRSAVADELAPTPRRMICINKDLGLHGPFFFPEQSGRDYELSPYLEVLGELREDFTVFSGLSHPEVDGGHASEASFLTAARHPGSSSFKNSISLDQYAAEQLRNDTRFGYLALSSSSSSISWTRTGSRIPAHTRPSKLYAKLFLEGSEGDVAQHIRSLRDGRSILDTVIEQARRLETSASRQDRALLDEYFTSVRELERRLLQAEEWADRPKPAVDYPPPQDITDKTDFVSKQRLMYDLAHLALQTDSTRLITLSNGGLSLVPPVAGVTADWHNLSHHGKDPEKLEQLKLIELEEMRLLGEFLTNLKNTPERENSLLDQTMVMYGSNLGNASSHNTRNMPILLAGGGFRHGQHLAFDPEDHPPLCNVHLSMLQQLGLETDSFASSTGTITGLETA